MLFTVAIVLILLWLLAITVSYTLGGFIHLLALAAFALVLVQVVNDQKAA